MRVFNWPYEYVTVISPPSGKKNGRVRLRPVKRTLQEGVYLTSSQKGTETEVPGPMEHRSGFGTRKSRGFRTRKYEKRL